MPHGLQALVVRITKSVLSLFVPIFWSEISVIRRFPTHVLPRVNASHNDLSLSMRSIWMQRNSNRHRIAKSNRYSLLVVRLALVAIHILATRFLSILIDSFSMQLPVPR